MTSNSQSARIDEQTIELIAHRVAALLRGELEAIAADLARPRDAEPPLTVEEVAQRFGVARSTVYAHWREWGGYKLGASEKSTIRFRPSELPSHVVEPPDQSRAAPEPIRRRPCSGSVLTGKPRLTSEFG
jgi:transposase-like protein